MKKSLLLLVLLSLVVALPVSAQPRFKDVPEDHWAADAVYDLVKRGVTEGFPDGTFRGNNNLTRYQNAAFLSRLAESIESKIVSEAKIQKMIDSAIAGSLVKKTVKSEGATVSGTLFVRYSNGMENSPNINNFDIERAYVTFKKAVGDNASAKVVLDSSRQTGKLETFLKYAYVDLNNTLPQGMIPGISMDTRIGMQPTYWSPWVDNILGLRVVASSLLGLNIGVTTSDFGIGGLGKVSLGGLPEVNYVVTALNGSSYASGENNVGKNIAFRVDSELMPGIIAAVGGQIEDVDTSSSGARLANVLIGYKTEPVKAYLEMFYGKGAVGYSAASLLNLGILQEILKAYGVFARIDIFDPDRDVDDDGMTSYWAGVTYDWNENVKIVLDYDAVNFASAAAMNAGKTVSHVVLRTQINL